MCHLTCPQNCTGTPEFSPTIKLIIMLCTSMESIGVLQRLTVLRHTCIIWQNWFMKRKLFASIFTLQKYFYVIFFSCRSSLGNKISVGGRLDHVLIRPN